MHDLEIRIGAVIVGRVLGPDGRPAELIDIETRLSSPRTKPRRRVEFPDNHIVSGEDGIFRIGQVPAGDALIRFVERNRNPGWAFAKRLNVRSGEIFDLGEVRPQGR